MRIFVNDLPSCGIGIKFAQLVYKPPIHRRYRRCAKIRSTDVLIRDALSISRENVETCKSHRYSKDYCKYAAPQTMLGCISFALF